MRRKFWLWRCFRITISILEKKTVQILPVKKKSTREKNQIFARENEFTAREKTKKSAREKK